jgi:hypothetical protein
MHIYEVTEKEPKESSYKVKVASLGKLIGNLPAARTRKIHSNTVWKNPATDPCDFDEEDYT